jgi:adenylate cyclase class 2
MQKEIEVKAKVGDLNAIRTQLEGLGCVFTEPTIQDDAWFVNFHTDFAIFMPKTNFLRIRKTKGKTFLTLKQPQQNEMDCIEKEIEISDAQACTEALELMGYHEVVKVYKTRSKTTYNDMGICLDDVRDLGTFVEVEKITEGEGEVVQNELFEFLQTLGVHKADRVMNGYDTLVYLKNKKE